MPQKSFKQNPALRFITSTQEPDALQAAEEASNPLPPLQVENGQAEEIAQESKLERKTKRLNLLLQPSVYEDISKVARMQKTSVNDLVNRVLKDYAVFQAETIKQHDRIFITIQKE